MRNHRTIAIAATLLLTLSASAWAGGRPDKDWKNWFGEFSLDYALAEETFGDLFEDDLGFSAGAVYWPSDWNVGIGLSLDYAQFDVRSQVVDAFNAQLGPGDGSITGAQIDTFTLMADVNWSPTGPDGPFYLTGGVGGAYLDGKVTDNGLVYYPPVCDPWWWWCYPGGYGPGTVVVRSRSTTRFAWNAGIGLSFEVGDNESQIFIEAKYQSVETSPKATTTIPLSVGFRW
jgi:opacity protein-like surface antigen